MRPHEIAARLEGFEQRGPGTDAERRAANWLARELSGAGREVRIDTFWCRPNWALAHAWHVALAIAGSLVSVSQPRVGAVLLVVALLSTAADALFGTSLGRRLTLERATQNVVVRARRGANNRASPVRLVITANYDAGRTGLVYRRSLRRAAASIRNATRGIAPGWIGWLCIAIAWLLVLAVLRAEHHRSTAVGIAQFIPTVLLVVSFAALLELATSNYSPAAGDNGAGTAVVAALLGALDAAPPRHMDLELVLQGAGEAPGAGLRSHLRRRSTTPTSGRRPRRSRRASRELDRTNAAIIAFAPSGAGQLRFWTSDGTLLPLRYSKRLRELCTQIAPGTGASPVRTGGSGPAYAARLAGIPAITLGCLDRHGLVPNSHRQSDTASLIDPAALDAALEFALILVDALDAFLARPAPPGAGTAPAAPAPAAATAAPAPAPAGQTVPHASDP